MLKFSVYVVGAILLLGVVGGTLSGLLGIGSGIIMVPVLSAIWAKEPDAQKLAQGTALAVMVPMAIAGSLTYHFGGGATNLRVTVPIVLWALLIGTIALAVPLRCGSLICVGETLGHVRWSWVALLALGAVIGSSCVGAPLAAMMNKDLLKLIFGIFIIIVGLRMVGLFDVIGGLFQRGG